MTDYLPLLNSSLKSTSHKWVGLQLLSSQLKLLSFPSIIIARVHKQSIRTSLLQCLLWSVCCAQAVVCVFAVSTGHGLMACCARLWSWGTSKCVCWSAAMRRRTRSPSTSCGLYRACVCRRPTASWRRWVSYCLITAQIHTAVLHLGSLLIYLKRKLKE